MKKILITVAISVLLYPVVVWLMAGFAIEGRTESSSDQGQVMKNSSLHLIQKTCEWRYHLDEDSSYELSGPRLRPPVVIIAVGTAPWMRQPSISRVPHSDALPALRPAAATTSPNGSSDLHAVSLYAPAR